MEHYIAIDAGFTKTEGVLTDESGHIIARVRQRGCNPMDIGEAAVKSTVLSVVESLLDAAPGPVVSLYGGIAGLDRIDIGLDDFLSQHFQIPHIRTEDDGFSLISGTLGHVDGCGMVCGTGASLFARRNGRSSLHIGGLGYLIDTGGSGYELGQAVLKASFRCLDGRGEYTILPELLAETLGKSPYQAFTDIYSGGRAFIASLAHLAFEGAAAGDAISSAILEVGAFRLGELTVAAAKHFDGLFPVVLSGGIPTAYPDYAEMIRSHASPRAQIVLAEVPPVYGGLVEAMWQNGVTSSPAVKATFLHDLHASAPSAGR